LELKLACGESKCSLKGNKINSDEYRNATRKCVVHDDVCKVGMGSADGDEGVLNDIGGCKSRPRSANREWSVCAGERPIQAEQRRKGSEEKILA
jgi:hypothetical protein